MLNMCSESYYASCSTAQHTMSGGPPHTTATAATCWTFCCTPCFNTLPCADLIFSASCSHSFLATNTDKLALVLHTLIANGALTARAPPLSSVVAANPSFLAAASSSKAMAPPDSIFANCSTTDGVVSGVCFEGTLAAASTESSPGTTRGRFFSVRTRRKSEVPRRRTCFVT